MRNVGGLRTFNPKLMDSAGGEVNDRTYRSEHENAWSYRLFQVPPSDNKAGSWEDFLCRFEVI